MCPPVRPLWLLIHLSSMETVWRPPPPPTINLTYSCADCLRTETRKATFQHSGFSKPVELPGALSQNRGLEREASPLPADELILEVKGLQAWSWLAAIRGTRLFLQAGHPDGAEKITSAHSCCMSMSVILVCLRQPLKLQPGSPSIPPHSRSLIVSDFPRTLK